MNHSLLILLLIYVIVCFNFLVNIVFTGIESLFMRHEIRHENSRTAAKNITDT